MVLQFAQTALIYTVPFLLVLTVVVTVHEFGHFIVARWCGVAVDRFSIGFGRALVSWRDKSGMEWRIGWIPLGGYVKFSGDESIASVPDAEDLAALREAVLAKEGPAALRRYFHFKPLWQRALVVAAGPVANFVLAITIYAALAMTIGELSVKPRVAEIRPHSAAAQAGFRSGDLILRADGQPISDFTDLQRLILLRGGDQIGFDIDRGGQVIHIVATPRRKTKADGPSDGPLGMGYLGVGPSLAPADVRMVRYGPIAAVGLGVRRTGEIIGTSLSYIGRIFAGRESGSQITGMLGMAGRTGHYAAEATHDAPDVWSGAAQLGAILIQIAAFMSVALGFANLLPIPVLDGGHLLFYGYEAVARRPLAAKVQDAGYRVGFALVIGLMLFSALNDLRRFGVFDFIGGLFS